MSRVRFSLLALTTAIMIWVTPAAGFAGCSQSDCLPAGVCTYDDCLVFSDGCVLCNYNCPGGQYCGFEMCSGFQLCD